MFSHVLVNHTQGTHNKSLAVHRPLSLWPRNTQAQERHRAEFNFSLQQRIESCTHWQQLAGLIEGLHHDQEGGRGRDLVNYISVARLCGRLGVLAGPGESKEGGTQEQERYAWLRGELAALVGEHASWFYSQHLAQVCARMS